MVRDAAGDEFEGLASEHPHPRAGQEALVHRVRSHVHSAVRIVRVGCGLAVRVKARGALRLWLRIGQHDPTTDVRPHYAPAAVMRSLLENRSHDGLLSFARGQTSEGAFIGCFVPGPVPYPSPVPSPSRTRTRTRPRPRTLYPSPSPDPYLYPSLYRPRPVPVPVPGPVPDPYPSPT